MKQLSKPRLTWRTAERTKRPHIYVDEIFVGVVHSLEGKGHWFAVLAPEIGIAPHRSDFFPTIEDAKKAALAYVKEHLKK
jgi:hypothetical protein